VSVRDCGAGKFRIRRVLTPWRTALFVVVGLALAGCAQGQPSGAAKDPRLLYIYSQELVIVRSLLSFF
jgi:hypothetical protein